MQKIDSVCLHHPLLAAAAKGTYLLIMDLERACCLSVGRLKTCSFPAGCLMYVGSALGPGGLRARLRHHLRFAQRPHWHLDYLRTKAKVTAIVFAPDGKRCEHEWAMALAELSWVRIPVPGFGASDCACASHLFYFMQMPKEENLPACIRQHAEMLTVIE